MAGHTMNAIEKIKALEPLFAELDAVGIRFAQASERCRRVADHQKKVGHNLNRRARRGEDITAQTIQLRSVYSEYGAAAAELSKVAAEFAELSQRIAAEI